ncbi:hypothetical protein TpMuguga_04g00433 [Theileria parva strain Muguga]|uniref:Uncharacterized protein n=1 Tax=Theileria parva TaxID=5875 RepID=Q4N2B8_THEPA|nr:uncharacterized protein TpMuguga_04g00433 [Theileria parva strain Muguga]EAN31785.1 hypothetical protein TpMuguga_04g00433 [Theileria parva strain Muguga]|eukprot:XP_764068.1 hypothetical protein [Theileria parva strain Muguga]
MLFFRFLKNFVNTSNNCFLPFKHKRNLTSSISPSTPNSISEPLTHDVVKNRTEWLIFINYLKYLSKHPKECKFDKCINILISTSDLFLKYNNKFYNSNVPTLKLEWNNGILRQVNTPVPKYHFIEYLNSSNTLSLLKIFSKLRLYHRINTHNFENKTSNVVKHEETCSSNLLFSDILDGLNSNSFENVSPKFRSGQSGPLRFNSNNLLVYPGILSNPFIFELADSSVINLFKTPIPAGLNSSEFPKNNFSHFIDTVMVQFLDQLLIFLSKSDFTESKLCVLSMYLTVMVYGPKLRNKNKCKVDKRVEDSIRKLFDYFIERVQSSKEEVSLRSLAYLINSCHPKPELFDYVSRRIIDHKGPIGEDYLENFAFVFARSYYTNDPLYEALASIINNESTNLGPLVTINLILSFSRISKLHLVKDSLFKRLNSFTDYQLKKCSHLLRSLKELSQTHPELNTVLNRINNL